MNANILRNYHKYNGNDESGFLEYVIRTQFITLFICSTEMGGWKGLKQWFSGSSSMSVFQRTVVGSVRAKGGLFPL